MIAENIKHRIKGIELLGTGWDEDLHDAVFVSIHYCSPKETCEIHLQSWNDDEDGNHRRILVKILFEGIRRFQIDDDIRGGFTTCIDVEQSEDQQYSGCLDFNAAEIGIRIRANSIIIVSVEPLE